MNTDDVHPRGGLGQSKISVHASTSLHRTRTPFSREDQSNVVDWLVQHHPQKEHRRGNAVWKQLVEDEVITLSRHNRFWVIRGNAASLFS